VTEEFPGDSRTRGSRSGRRTFPRHAQPRGGRVPVQARLRPVCTLSYGIQPALLLNVYMGFLGSLSTVTPVRMTASGPTLTSSGQITMSAFEEKADL
jgi:hypothetical protein